MSSNLSVVDVFNDELTHASGILSPDLHLIVLFTDVNDLSCDETADLLTFPWEL